MTSKLLDTAHQRVLVLDGAMGTSVHSYNLPLSDYRGLENCTEILVDTRPDVVREIHRSFLAVGCDAVLTNTFGANKILFDESGIADRTRELNRRAAELAREAATEFDRPNQPRFVIGSMGPGTKLPSLLQTTWDKLVDSYREQSRGLLDGGVDAVVVETCQDILQAKSAIVGTVDAMKESGIEVPIFCTVTIETSGTMLLGTEIGAALVALEAYDQVVGIGINCATGPAEMSEHVRHLSAHCDRMLIVQPNAGLPQLVDDEPHYTLTPDELARWLLEFVEVDGVNIVGGCCGTTPQHLAAVVDAIGKRAPKNRTITSEPSVSSVYQAVALRQDTDILAIGERANANGSKMFRDMLAAGDEDGMVQTAREQIQHGSHCLDVCVACVGRNEEADMSTVIKRFATEVTVPLVIDSTEAGVIETALKLAGGKCVINSINLEDGEEKLDKVCRLARRHGAALIALTVDEQGTAKTVDRKVEIARRIHDLATSRHGIRACDLIFDPLTFTICTGNEEDRRLGLETLEALRRIKEELPGVHTLLGVSNISFGVKPPVRRVLNSVFLHFAREQGLDAAILHAVGILPLFKIPKQHRKFAEDLIFDRRSEGYDPLHALLEALADEAVDSEPKREPSKDVAERLKRRIVDGDRRGLDEDIEEALTTYPPLEIVNDILLDGMKTVGDLFGAGQMQLPFVLQSAQTMRAAMGHLEPLIESVDGRSKGSIVLATVRGDVHDIGKNLVDIILTNNGYTVHNLGIKQPINAIIDAHLEHRADAIGMSGLLVKSTAVMRENLAVLNERGITAAVILGGAALTRKYVESELRPEYNGPLCYAKDALEGLHLMDKLISGEIAETAMARAGKPVAVRAAGHPGVTDAKLRTHRQRGGAGPPHRHPQVVPPKSDISRTEPVPQPPFWGSRVVEHIDPETALAYLNENMLFQVQWGYRKNRRLPEDFRRHIDDVVRPIYRDLLAWCRREEILRPQAVYGFWPCQSDGDTLIVYDPHDRTQALETFEFPRQRKEPYWCLSDFFRPIESGQYDVVAFSIVTVGRKVGEVAHQMFSADRYKDYLHLHGLSVECAEATAEYLHKRIRIEWSIADSAVERSIADSAMKWSIADSAVERSIADSAVGCDQDPSDLQDIFKQKYRGSRYSFGYPACPRLEDQVKLWPLLQPERIGVTLSETFQLEPEQSTTALITHHRQAKYFNVL